MELQGITTTTIRFRLPIFQEVDAVIERIRLMPGAWPKIGKQTRCRLIKCFPDDLLYAIEIDEILIMAVAHVRRNPEHYMGGII